MSGFIFEQLWFARNNTIERVSELDEASSLITPEHFNNNIKWNLGHIYLIHEKFAFHVTGEETKIPGNFLDIFSPGTRPSEWINVEIPKLDELITMLKKQVDRIEKTQRSQLKTYVDKPYTTSTGLTLSTVEALLSFCLYHEGMHFDAIKSIKRIIQSEM
ncbi:MULTISPECIES: DinB family protein [Paraliobacillus]|uniref:DinB family protein n=1 Tax=Paraliobacillus TaxID=200903 RepID=UPI000DD3B7BC|nr:MULTISPECIES: DinB family protein [Paraliobacillus]